MQKRGYLLLHHVWLGLLCVFLHSQFIWLPLSLAQISGASRFPYLLYVLTVSGVAYLLRIRNLSAYASISIFPVEELLEVNVRGYIANHAATIAAVTATAGGLVVGTSDGSVFCFQLGVLDPSAPGMNLLFSLLTCVFSCLCLLS